MEVSDVEVVDLDEPGRALHLALGALAAVDEDAIAAGADEQARGRPPSRGHGATGAEKDNVEVHRSETVTPSGPESERRGVPASG